jgi:squalene-hopene/tetraprenyl-beta-curcumene cyclase
MALHAAGYPLDHPVVAAGLNGFNLHWSYEKNSGIYLQPSESPIWDTVLSLLALLDCGMPDQALPAARRAVEYLLAEQVLVGGDWQVFVPNVEPGGWAFEFENDKYPDVDDTAVAIIVLLRLIPYLDDPDLEKRIRTAVDKAVNWTLAMQNPNGGGAACDRANTSKILTLLPFADFGELLDPPSVDVTAHVVEALGLYGHGLDSPPVARAVAYMRSEQEEDGSWFGRWGVNHIYGTAAVLPALEMVGEDMGQDYIQRGCSWLKEHQNRDGGWGETCGSYMDESLRGKGPSTASQTGWALMALLAAFQPDHEQAISRGLDYLAATQLDSGTWDEPWYTGTGFPGYGVGERVNLAGKQEELGQGAELARGFMLNYNMYRHYFPLIAMGRARQRWENR